MFVFPRASFILVAGGEAIRIVGRRLSRRSISIPTQIDTAMIATRAMMVLANTAAWLGSSWGLPRVRRIRLDHPFSSPLDRRPNHG